MSKKKAEKLGLHIFVFHPDSVEWLVPIPPQFEPDADGHCTHFSMASMGGDCLVNVDFRRGISPGTAIEILQKLAGYIERYGSRLLNMTKGNRGGFTPDGNLKINEIQSYDDGDFEIPEAI